MYYYARTPREKHATRVQVKRRRVKTEDDDYLADGHDYRFCGEPRVLRAIFGERIGEIRANYR